MSFKHLRRQSAILAVLVGLALIVALALSITAVHAQDREVGTGKTYATIQAAVAAADPGDVILVYPGTYAESVDLSAMNPDGNIILRSVNNAGVPTKDTATISPASGDAIRTASQFNGDVTIEGFIIESADNDGIDIEVTGDVVVRDVTANGTHFDGIWVEVAGNVLFDNVTANGNGDDGLDVEAATGGSVTVTNCIANLNEDDGMNIDRVGGDVTISGCTTNDNGQGAAGEFSDGIELAENGTVGGDATLSNCTSDRNQGDGMDIRHVAGLVSLSDCQTNQNHDDGLDIDEIPGSVALVNVTMNDNGDGDGDEAGLEVGEEGGVTGYVTLDTCTANDNNEDGLGITQVGGVVSITHGVANRNGWGIWVWDVVGEVTIEHSEAMSNPWQGFEIGETDAQVTLRDCEASYNSGEPDADGIQIAPAYGDVELTDCTAHENGNDGMDLDSIEGDVIVVDSTTNGNGTGSGVDVGAVVGDVYKVWGTVFISGCTSLDNGTDGFEVWTRQDVTVTACTGNGNGDDGIEVDADGTIWASGFHADGNVDEGIDFDAVGDVTVSNSTSINNGPGLPAPWAMGMYLESDGDATVTNCTASNNANDGYFFLVDGGVTMINSIAQGNADDGIDVESVNSLVSVYKGGVICGNFAGLGMYTERNGEAEANWWGAVSGPTHPSNPGGSGDEIWDGGNKASGAVDYTPWIDTLDASATVDPVEAGTPTVVSFQISGAGGTVFMGPGPGDLSGTPPFTVTTNNGTLADADETASTVHSFINEADGVLSVTLRPGLAGTATVTLDGPCGLDTQLAVLVEPGTQEQLKVFLPITLKNY